MLEHDPCIGRDRYSLDPPSRERAGLGPENKVESTTAGCVVSVHENEAPDIDLPGRASVGPRGAGPPDALA